ncbi:Neural-cadherin [Papilio xuthus]|uniref:Neural-cadherin n=1 Tax=Papilio xuthus TaxID=66420 RepID=A0A194PKC0_PAPXU|nr:Neural-cadherin [Papilio xuthus]
MKMIKCEGVGNLYYFFVSVTKFIRIGIADKNDNPPYFDKELYEAEVDENEDIQHTVLTVTAKDHDECK